MREDRGDGDAEAVLAAAWGPAARDALVRALEDAGPGARVLFDFDNTIVRGDLGDVALLALLEDGALARPSREAWGPLTPEAERAIGRAFGDEEPVGPEDARRAALCALLAHVLVKETLPDGRPAFEPVRTRAMRGSYFAMAALIDALSPEARIALAERAWADAIERPESATRLVEGHEVAVAIRPRPAMLALRALAEARGLEAWIVTASHEDLVRTVAPRVGFDPARVIGARTSRSLAAWPRVEGGPVMTFDVGKRAHVAHHVEGVPIPDALEHVPRVAIACGDADTDHAMLEDATHALVLVDRGQPRVSALAARREAEARVHVIRVAP